MKFEFSQQVLEKNPQIPNIMKIRPMGTELLHTDGRTDGRIAMTKPIVAFRNFANALKNVISVTQGNRHHIKILD